MIQYQTELAENVEKLRLLSGICYFQKIYSSSKLVCLSARFQGCTRYLYLGRGHGVEGFWVADKKIPAELRRVDRFLEYLRKYLSSTELVSISQVFSDRCIKMIYRRYGKESAFIFFWKGRSLYFLNYFFDDRRKNFYLMKSWQGKEISGSDVGIGNLHELLFEIGLKKKPLGQIKKSKTSVNDIIIKERERLMQLNRSPKRVKFLRRKIDHINHDLRKVECVAALQERLKRGELDSSIVGTEFKFEEIKIKFDSKLNFFQKRDRIFEKIKGYKRAKKILEARKEQTDRALEELHSGHGEINKGSLKVVQPYWISPKNKREVKKDKIAHKIKVFKTKEGLCFAIGMDAASNDFLRSGWGGRDDFWFHFNGYPGPHLVVRESCWDKISLQLIKILASALRDFSKQEMSEIPLVYTRVRNTKGVKGNKGKIIYRKEKYIKMDYDRTWREQVEEL